MWYQALLSSLPALEYKTPRHHSKVTMSATSGLAQPYIIPCKAPSLSHPTSPMTPFPPFQPNGRVKWAAIAALLPGRTDKAVAMRHARLLKRCVTCRCQRMMDGLAVCIGGQLPVHACHTCTVGRGRLRITLYSLPESFKTASMAPILPFGRSPTGRQQWRLDRASAREASTLMRLPAQHSLATRMTPRGQPPSQKQTGVLAAQQATHRLPARQEWRPAQRRRPSGGRCGCGGWRRPAAARGACTGGASTPTTLQAVGASV